VDQIADWLKKLDLGEYAQRFAENGIDFGVLPDLTDHDLEDLGVLLGHRRKILRAIGALTESKAVAVQPPPHDAERRQLTVMFCDLVGSTALSRSLDVEDLHDVIGAYHGCCAEAIKHEGGFVARYMGDGVLAYFGYPHAHEDDAERAVRAGLALVNSVAKLDAHVGTPLRARIGIATGVVIVGDVLGESTAQEHAVVGETPNLAARLQTLAEPNKVTIDRNTRRLLGDLFEFRSLGLVSIQGFEDPVAVWQVTGASGIDSRFEALRAASTPLVGREEEINLIMSRWQQSKGGDGSIVMISGEAGIGKSRIAETVVERLSGEPHARLRLYCSPHHQDSAFYPWITQLERAAGFRREDAPEQRLDKLEAVLALATSNPRETAPILATLLSIPTGNRYPPQELGPKKRKEKTLSAFVAQVEALAARQPVLIVVEDAHWCDPSSRDLFDLIIDRVATLPILVVVTLRPEFTPPWAGLAHVTQLYINRLQSRQCAEMISDVAGGKALPHEIADQIVDRTDGVPLFIEELTKAVIESGVLADAGERWTLAGPLPPLAIPTSLNASLLARLDHLARVREVAQMGAALGRRFSHELISAVASMPQRQLDDALSMLVGNALILRRGIPPDAEYTFKHALVQDAAYSTLLRRRRLQLHGRITQALEGQFPEIVEAQPELLARHCAEAGLVEKAVDYYLKAGRQAIAKGAMTEAVAQLKKGLDLLSRVTGGTHHEQELNLQIALGQALLATSGYAAPEPGDAYARARYLCQRLDRWGQLGPILYGQFVFHLVRGELERAEHHATEMRRLGEARNDLVWSCVGSRISGVICCVLGKFTDARMHCENALSLWDSSYRAAAAAPADPHVSTLLYLSRTLICLGYIDQARLQRDEALAEARRLSPFTLAYGLYVAWASHWAIEGMDSAKMMLGSADEVLAISREQGFPLLLGFGNMMRGWSLAALGQPKEGIRLLLDGLAIYRDTGARLALPFVLTTLAETYARAELPEEGLNRLAEAASVVEITQERWAEAEMHRLRGSILLQMHQHLAAEKCYRRALAVARGQSAKFWELRAATSLARLWRDQGKHTAAWGLLSPCCEWFTEGLETPVLRDGKQLLGQLA
jgi:class 3 adenylate cyclase/predicted ATPase